MRLFLAGAFVAIAGLRLYIWRLWLWPISQTAVGPDAYYGWPVAVLDVLFALSVFGAGVWLGQRLTRSTPPPPPT